MEHLLDDGTFERQELLRFQYVDFLHGSSGASAPIIASHPITCVLVDTLWCQQVSSRIYRANI
jgi:hypothetical protein